MPAHRTVIETDGLISKVPGNRTMQLPQLCNSEMWIDLRSHKTDARFRLLFPVQNGASELAAACCTCHAPVFESSKHLEEFVKRAARGVSILNESLPAPVLWPLGIEGANFSTSHICRNHRVIELQDLLHAGV